MTPGKLPNWESGPQNQPRLKVAVSNVPDWCMSEEGRPMPDLGPLDNRVILSPPFIETMAATVINPNNTKEATYDFIVNYIPC
jgi:hypothetical protein